MGSSASTLKSSRTSKKDTVMICASCSLALNVFNKKKCTLCQQIFCSKCLNNQFLMPLKPKICQKCLKLSSRMFTRNDLEVYSVKELRQFLSRNSIPLDNCCEKSDLVALVLMTANHCSNLEDTEHKKHVQLLREKMEKEMSTCQMTTVTPESNSGSFRRPQDLDDDEVLQLSEVASSCPGAVQTLVHRNLDSDHGETVDALNENSIHNIIMEHETIPVYSEISEMNSSCSPKAENFRLEAQLKDPVQLEDIKEVSQLELLNVRQMKEILTRNFVNYKGCCERNELLDMIVNLWKEHSRNASCENLDHFPRGDVCKICMDQVIDCVLLECGHMVACKKCSKQLAECPICRKYVSRVVHVFRA